MGRTKIYGDDHFGTLLADYYPCYYNGYFGFWDHISGTHLIGNVPATKLRTSETLDWFQTSSAGYDHYLAAGCLADHTSLTCASGTYGQAVSEHMFAQLLCLMKKLHLYRDNQGKALWHDEGTVRTLAGAKVLVLGAGSIGSGFARLCVAMGGTLLRKGHGQVSGEPSGIGADIYSLWNDG